jgi:hypothetical protein
MKRTLLLAMTALAGMTVARADIFSNTLVRTFTPSNDVDQTLPFQMSAGAPQNSLIFRFNVPNSGQISALTKVTVDVTFYDQSRTNNASRADNATESATVSFLVAGPNLTLGGLGLSDLNTGRSRGQQPLAEDVRRYHNGRSEPDVG